MNKQTIVDYLSANYADGEDCSGMSTKESVWHLSFDELVDLIDGFIEEDE